MQRIATAKLLSRFRAERFRWHGFLISVPRCKVRSDDGFGGVQVHLFKQPAAENLDGFIFFGRIQLGGFSRDNLLGFFECLQRELMLGLVGILRFLVFCLDRQGKDQGDMRCRRHGLNQTLDEGRKLLGGIGKNTCHLSQVNGNFVDHDKRRFAAEKFHNGAVAGRGVGFIAAAHALESFASRQPIGHLAPNAACKQTRLECESVGGIGFSPSSAAMRTLPFGRSLGSRNSEMFPTPFIPRTAWMRAIRLCVLPPPYCVSRRTTEFISPPTPLKRRQTVSSSC